MKRLLLAALAIGVISLALSASIASATAPTVVAGAGTIPNPNIPVFCPNLSADQPFTLEAQGSGSDLSGRGSMSATTADFDSCSPLKIKANVTCLLDTGNEAVAFGPVTSLSHPTGFPTNFLAVIVQDGGPSGDSGNVIPMFISGSPGDCSQVGLFELLLFGTYPFTSGNVAFQ
jgi:hypothetical protein